jgi:2-iminoacetate synthase
MEHSRRRRTGSLRSYSTKLLRRTCLDFANPSRTGEHFMEFAIPGFIKRFCTPNALLTLKEYLVDYAPDEVAASGERLNAEELATMTDGSRKEQLIERLALIDQGERDLHF